MERIKRADGMKRRTSSSDVSSLAESFRKNIRQWMASHVQEGEAVGEVDITPTVKIISGKILKLPPATREAVIKSMEDMPTTITGVQIPELSLGAAPRSLEPITDFEGYKLNIEQRNHELMVFYRRVIDQLLAILRQHGVPLARASCARARQSFNQTIQDIELLRDRRATGLLAAERRLRWRGRIDEALLLTRLVLIAKALHHGYHSLVGEFVYKALGIHPAPVPRSTIPLTKHQNRKIDQWYQQRVALKETLLHPVSKRIGTRALTAEDVRVDVLGRAVRGAEANRMWNEDLDTYDVRSRCTREVESDDKMVAGAEKKESEQWNTNCGADKRREIYLARQSAAVNEMEAKGDENEREFIRMHKEGMDHASIAAVLESEVVQDIERKLYRHAQGKKPRWGRRRKMTA